MFVGHSALRYLKDQVVSAVKFLRPFDAGDEILRVPNQDQVSFIECFVGNPGKNLGHSALVGRKRFRRMRAALVQAAEEPVVVKNIAAAVTVRLLVTLPAIHLENPSHLTLRWVVPSFLQGLTIELNVLPYPLLGRYKKRCGEMEPLRPGPNAALWCEYTRRVDRRVGLFYGLGEKGVVP